MGEKGKYNEVIKKYSYVDGEEEIQVGYSLTATAVTPIKLGKK